MNMRDCESHQWLMCSCFWQSFIVISMLRTTIIHVSFNPTRSLLVHSKKSTGPHGQVWWFCWSSSWIIHHSHFLNLQHLISSKTSSVLSFLADNLFINRSTCSSGESVWIDHPLIVVLYSSILFRNTYDLLLDICRLFVVDTKGEAVWNPYLNTWIFPR